MITLAIDNFNGPKPLGNAGQDYPKLFYYLKENNIDVEVYHTLNAPKDSWYPITIKWFDFNKDYFADINPLVFKHNHKIVFSYNEADNPKDINQRLTKLAEQYNHNNIAFISGNSSADQYKYTYYWPEVEYLFQRQIDFIKVPKTHFKRRSKHFTALVRIDKLWRKVFMSNLWAKGLHKNGYFSYCQEQLGYQDDWDGLPLYNEWLAEQMSRIAKFIQAGPFFVDNLSSDERNNYAVTPVELYEDSYFNFVLETNIDVDSSGGQCITEKTFKPILHCQPFICVAEHNHLKHLRDLGYQTFDNIIDESYDSIENSQERFERVMQLSEELANKSLDELHEMYIKVEDRLLHNRQLLESDLSHRLKKLTTDLNSV